MQPENIPNPNFNMAKGNTRSQLVTVSHNGVSFPFMELKRKGDSNQEVKSQLAVDRVSRVYLFLLFGESLLLEEHHNFELL